MANPNMSGSGSMSGTGISSAIEKTKSAVSSGLAGLDQHRLDQINHLKDEALDRASVFYERSEQVVRRNPFYFIGGAALLGYVAGMLMSRKG